MLPPVRVPETFKLVVLAPVELEVRAPAERVVVVAFVAYRLVELRFVAVDEAAVVVANAVVPEKVAGDAVVSTPET